MTLLKNIYKYMFTTASSGNPQKIKVVVPGPISSGEYPLYTPTADAVLEKIQIGRIANLGLGQATVRVGFRNLDSLTDGFESYQTGTIIGQSGGTGFTGSWYVHPIYYPINNNSISVQGAVKNSGSQALQTTGDTTLWLTERSFSPIALNDTVLTCYAQHQGTIGGGGWDIALYNSGAPDATCSVSFGIDGDFRVLTTTGGGPWIKNIPFVTPWVAGQWYKLQMKLNFTAQTYQVQIDDGGWSMDLAFWIPSSQITAFRVLSEYTPSTSSLFTDDVDITFGAGGVLAELGTEQRNIITKPFATIEGRQLKYFVSADMNNNTVPPSAIQFSLDFDK